MVGEQDTKGWFVKVVIEKWLLLKAVTTKKNEEKNNNNNDNTLIRLRKNQNRSETEMAKKELKCKERKWQAR